MRWDLLGMMAGRSVIGLVSIDALLFGVAGRTDWMAPWVLTSVCAGFMTAGGGWLLYKDPDLLKERLMGGADVPQWDRIVIGAYWVLFVALLVTSALDAGRFRWSRMSPMVQAIAGAGMMSAFATMWWCAAVNHFLSSQARIQSERGHRVVRDGPYQYVRHPMYTAMIVLMASIALLLGSWLALVPAALIGILFVIRTSLEDRMLQRGLPGYQEYAERVRYRLVPAVW